MTLDGDMTKKCLACGKLYVDRSHGLIGLLSACPACGSHKTIPIGFN